MRQLICKLGHIHPIRNLSYVLVNAPRCVLERIALEWACEQKDLEDDTLDSFFPTEPTGVGQDS